jgi:hypothetical protein
MSSFGEFIIQKIICYEHRLLIRMSGKYNKKNGLLQEQIMKYLIIGGTGLISTPITRFLLERGEDVTLYNRGQNAQRFPAGARVIRGDRSDLKALRTRS